MIFKKSNKSAFTIVEVTIVLAIASLIIAIVFVAVAAANRSSRDAKRKSDTLAFQNSIEQWASNHSGSLPTIGSGAIIEPGDTTVGAFSEENYYPNNFTDPSTGDPYNVQVGTEPLQTCTADARGTLYYLRRNARSFSLRMCLESGAYNVN